MFTTLKGCLRKKKKSQITNLMLHLRKQGKEQQTEFKISWRKWIIRIRAEINESKYKTEIQNIKKLQIDGETMATAKYFIFLGSKITADSDCCFEIKRRLLLWRKVITNLDSILKSRDIILLTNVC